jgi:hypothetical protein
MKLDFDVINDCPDYRDIDAYIVDDTGAEWLFRIYKVKEDNQIVTCDARYSPDCEEGFGDEGEHTPPVEVLQLLDQHRPQIVDRLNFEDVATDESRSFGPHYA